LPSDLFLLPDPLHPYRNAREPHASESKLCVAGTEAT
jgi:hypothetical protein